MKQHGDPPLLALFISDVDDGGAAIACQRVYAEVNRLTSHACRWVVATANRQAGAVSAASWPSLPALFSHEVKRRMCTGERWLAEAEHRFNEINIRRLAQRWQPRVLCLYNIHQKASFDLLRSLPENAPMLICLQDMWYLTGYCCFSMGHDGYATGCQGVCPQRGKWETPTRAADKEWRHRERFFLRNAHRIRLIAPSRWMAQCAGERFRGRIPVEHIPNPVDTAVFKPVAAKRTIRAMLGLDEDRPMVLCGAVTMKDSRKGASYLREALQRVRRRVGAPFTVALFGTAGEEAGIPDAVSLGAIRDERLLNLYYNAATVFVLPSLAESFGLVFAEAMAAGTPCVAFDTTACGELVREGETGYLARVPDVESLADAIERALAAGDDNPLGRNGRDFVVKTCDMRVVGAQHLNLIESVLTM